MSNDNTIEHVTEDTEHVDDHTPLSVDAAIPADSDTEDDSKPARPSRVERLEAEGDAAADFLEELLDIADFDGDIDMDVEGDRASVSIVGGDLQDLVGRDGDVLDALQELTRLAVLRETGERSRLMLDIAGFRATRKGQLVEVAEKAIAHVKAEGAPLDLDPMTPFERKVVHDVVAAAGLSSESHGTEPRRYVVVVPSS